MKVRKISNSVLFRSHPSGVMSEDQLEGILLGYFYRATLERDRRAGATVVGERPVGSMVWDEESNQWVSDAGDPIMGGVDVHRATGLPESASALLPNHRATVGWDLALDLVIPPEDFIAAIIYTDDIPENAGKPDDQKEQVALFTKEKYVVGPRGGVMADHRCLVCGEEWQAEMENVARCIRCAAEGAKRVGGKKLTSVVDRRVLDGWSDEEVACVKENTRRLKRVVHRLAEQGLFITKPKIDEHKAGELGTDELVHGKDHMTMGFAITPKGLEYAEAFVRKHPKLATGHGLLDALGETRAKDAPEWFKASERQKGKVHIESSPPSGSGGGVLSRIKGLFGGGK